MSRVFGITNHSPDQALAFLLKKGVIAQMSDVAIVPFGTNLKEDSKPVRKVLFIVTISDFYRNLKVINSTEYKDAILFIFASPLRVSEIVNIIPLDYEDNPSNRGVSFVMKKEMSVTAFSRALKANIEGPVSRLESKYLTLVTDTAKRGSLLNPLMTFIYTLPSSSHQTKVKEAVATYLYKGISFARLEAIFDELRDVSISQKSRDRIQAILVSDVGDNYRAAFKELRLALKSEKLPSLTSICKRHGTSEYEMRYLKAVVDSKANNKDSTGKTLSAQNLSRMSA